MDGITLCPHCNTRFRITAAQLDAHHGMVRCGHCLHIFDARPEFLPDPPDPQLELPMPEISAPELIPDETPPAASEPGESVAADATTQPEGGTETFLATLETEHIEPEETEPASAAITVTAEDDLTSAEIRPEPEIGMLQETGETQAAPTNEAEPAPDTEPEPHTPAAMTLAEQVVIVHDESETTEEPVRRTWLWAIASILLVLLLLAQAAYFFRIDLAARQPELKPLLVGYCALLDCTIPLPQQINEVSIESSSLEAVPTHENRIILNALLRNRAPFAQAFPHLELTLNDTEDKPLARRVFGPADYLPHPADETAGFQANHESGIRLLLDTDDLKPSGYRLVLFYPQ